MRRRPYSQRSNGPLTSVALRPTRLQAAVVLTGGETGLYFAPTLGAMLGPYGAQFLEYLSLQRGSLPHDALCVENARYAVRFSSHQSPGYRTRNDEWWRYFLADTLLC